MHDWPWYASWPRGLPISLDYPLVPVYKVLESSAARYPTREAIIFHVGEVATTYRDLWEQARSFGTALHRMGVRKGEVVAIQLPNSPQFAIAYYGTLLIGATVTPCSPLLSAPELQHQLNDSGAQTMVTLDMFMTTVASVRPKSRLKRVIVSGIQEAIPPYPPVDAKVHGPKSYSFQQLLMDTTPALPRVKIDAETDVAHLAYTGGTTGIAKGVVLTHRAVLANTLQFAHWTMGGRPLYRDGLLHIVGAPEPGPDEPWEYPFTGEAPEGARALIVVPWFHAMGIVGYLNFPVYAGATMVVHPRFDPAAYAQDIVKHRAWVFGGAPPILQAVLNLPDSKEMDFSSVRLVVSGAAPLAVETLTGTAELVPGAVVMEGYGLTEMTMGVTSNPAARSSARKGGSVGIPVFDTDLKIVDLDDPDLEIGCNELGEVCVRGPQMMQGYYGRPEDTEKVIRSGWVRTGDIGRVDDDGYLFIVDRKKDMLIYKGHNVYPRELEHVVLTHPAVADCTVIGKPDPSVGELPKAFIVLKPEAKAQAEEIMDYVATQVAAYKKIREIEFVEAIPVSLAGKPMKRELRERESQRARARAREEAEAAAREEAEAVAREEAAATTDDEAGTAAQDDAETPAKHDDDVV